MQIAIVIPLGDATAGRCYRWAVIDTSLTVGYPMPAPK
jgi:hypothetical protein